MRGVDEIRDFVANSGVFGSLHLTGQQQNSVSPREKPRQAGNVGVAPTARLLRRTAACKQRHCHRLRLSFYYPAGLVGPTR